MSVTEVRRKCVIGVRPLMAHLRPEVQAAPRRMESESGPSPRCSERFDVTAYGDDGVTALTQLGDLHKPLRATDASASAGELAVPQVAYLLATRLTERAQRMSEVRSLKQCLLVWARQERAVRNRPSRDVGRSRDAGCCRSRLQELAYASLWSTSGRPGAALVAPSPRSSRCRNRLPGSVRRSLCRSILSRPANHQEIDGLRQHRFTLLVERRVAYLEQSLARL